MRNGNRFHVMLFLLAVVFVSGTVYGIVIQKFQVFPYAILKISYHKIFHQNESLNYGPWSIGIFKGTTPFNLKDPDDVSNPVLTAKDVTDVDAVYVADPFMLTVNEKHFLFFEVKDRKTNQGVIAYAVSTDLKKWDYRGVIIDEMFHLSYPYVFEWDNNFYLIPESHEDFSVRLYKAKDFPEKWEYVGNLLSGYRYVDNTILHHSGMWWLFTSTGQNNILNLYFSENLLNGWKPHPLNPIVKHDKHFSRPAGRFFVFEDKLYRLVQDGYPSYGIQVFAVEITELTESSYSERLSSTIPLIKNSGTGWNAYGMHHLDLHKIDNEFVGIVDGRDR